jgi:sporulation protein YtfJ
MNGWLIFLLVILVIILLLLIPVGVQLTFEKELRVRLKIGFIPITLYPKKPKKPKKEKKKKEKTEEAPKKEEKKEKKPGLIKQKGLSWLLDTAKNAAILTKGVLRDFFRHLKIKRLLVSINYCGEDADDTAVKYGYLCLSVYPAVSILVNISKCRRYGVDITPLFDANSESSYYVDFEAGIRLLWLFVLLFRHGFKAIRLLLSLRNKTKADKSILEEEKKRISEKGEFAMDHPIGNLMNVTMEKIKEMVDVNTIVGEPITSADGTLIIPVSKVSYGFASGGSDLPTKTEKNLFGGGSGAGVTIQPIAFLTVYQGNVRLISVNNNGDGLDRLVDMVPDVVEKVKGFFKKDKKDDAALAAADDFSEITIDDIE